MCARGACTWVRVSLARALPACECAILVTRSRSFCAPLETSLKTTSSAARPPRAMHLPRARTHPKSELWTEEESIRKNGRSGLQGEDVIEGWTERERAGSAKRRT
eukprot:1314596-Pleurochrysis_carterae.AAC.1